MSKLGNNEYFHFFSCLGNDLVDVLTHSNLIFFILLLTYWNPTISNICKSFSKKYLNGNLSLQTDALSSQKASANLSPREPGKDTKPISAYDDAVVSAIPGTDDPSACNHRPFFFNYMFYTFFELEWLDLLTPACYSKLICCKHFLQQKALFEEGPTISGWMTKFCLDSHQRILTRPTILVIW